MGTRGRKVQGLCSRVEHPRKQNGWEHRADVGADDLEPTHRHTQTDPFTNCGHGAHALNDTPLASGGGARRATTWMVQPWTFSWSTSVFMEVLGRGVGCKGDCKDDCRDVDCIDSVTSEHGRLEHTAVRRRLWTGGAMCSPREKVKAGVVILPRTGAAVLGSVPGTTLPGNVRNLF